MLKAQILSFDRRIMAWHQSNETSKRLDQLPGVGPALATALVASVPEPKASGCHCAWVNLNHNSRNLSGLDAETFVCADVGTARGIRSSSCHKKHWPGVRFGSRQRTMLKGGGHPHLFGMSDLWTWSGKYFGRRDGDALWTYQGRHVGCFHGDEIYGPDGLYLGELWNGNRLITNTTKRSLSDAPFTPCKERTGQAPYAAVRGYTPYAGYQEFPAPESFG